MLVAIGWVFVKRLLRLNMKRPSGVSQIRAEYLLDQMTAHMDLSALNSQARLPGELAGLSGTATIRDPLGPSLEPIAAR